MEILGFYIDHMLGEIRLTVIVLGIGSIVYGISWLRSRAEAKRIRAAIEWEKQQREMGDVSVCVRIVEDGKKD